MRDRAALCTTTDAGQKAAEPRFLNFLSFEGRGRRAAPGQKGKNSNAPDQIRHRAGDHVSTYLRISSRLSKRKKAERLPLGAMEAFLLGDKDWLVMFHRLPADQGVRTANKTERDPRGKLRRLDTSKLPTYGTAGN